MKKEEINLTKQNVEFSTKPKSERINEEIKHLGLTKEQSTKVFSKIDEDYEIFMVDLKYSAPEVCRKKIQTFLWGIYLQGRMEKKEDILKLF